MSYVHRALVGAAALAIVELVTAAPAQAGNGPMIEHGEALLRGLSTEIGGIAQTGFGELALTTGDGVAPLAQGIVLRDRNGLVSRGVIGLLIAASTAMAASGPKSVETRTYQQGDWTVRETTTTYYSEEEKKEMLDNAGKTIGGLFGLPNADFELQIYSRDRWGRGDASGHKATFLVGGGDGLVFEAGFGWGDVNSIVEKDGVTYALDHKYLGIPFRVSGAFRPLRWSLTWEWNWLAHGIDELDRTPTMDAEGVMHAQVGHHPLHLDLEGALFGRVFVTGGATLASVRDTDVGYRASLGFRF